MKKALFCLLLLLVSVFPQPTRVAAASPPDWEAYTYALSQSTSAYQFWTTAPSERVFKNSPVPTASGSEVKLYAACNEFEPFVLVVKPAASGNVTVTLDSFGAGITAELYQVKYVNITTTSDSLGQTGPYPDPGCRRSW